MRPTLTIASSLTPHLPWWRNVSLPSGMVEKAVSMVLRNMAGIEPRDGVAVTIRVPSRELAERWALEHRRLLDAYPNVVARLPGWRP